MRRPVKAGVCVEGQPGPPKLFRTRCSSWGNHHQYPQKDYDWSGFGAAGAISHLNRLINQLMEIPLPKEPKSKMTFGGLTAGSSFNTSPKTGRLRFEITSEGDDVIDDLETRLNEICEQFSMETGTEVRMETVAKKTKLRNPLYSSSRENNPCDYARGRHHAEG